MARSRCHLYLTISFSEGPASWRFRPSDEFSCRHENLSRLVAIWQFSFRKELFPSGRKVPDCGKMCHPDPGSVEVEPHLLAHAGPWTEPRIRAASAKRMVSDSDRIQRDLQIKTGLRHIRSRHIYRGIGRDRYILRIKWDMRHCFFLQTK